MSAIIVKDLEKDNVREMAIDEMKAVTGGWAAVLGACATFFPIVEEATGGPMGDPVEKAKAYLQSKQQAGK